MLLFRTNRKRARISEQMKNLLTNRLRSKLSSKLSNKLSDKVNNLMTKYLHTNMKFKMCSKSHMTPLVIDTSVPHSMDTKREQDILSDPDQDFQEGR